MQPETVKSNILIDNTPTDIIGTLLKKKFEGFLVFFLIIAGGIALSFILPPQYKTTEILRLAQVKNHLLETTKTINGIPQSDTEILQLAEELKTTSGKARKRFTLRDMESNPNFAVIIGRGTTSQEAMQSTQVLSKTILARQQALYQPTRDQFEKEINAIESDKEKTQNGIQRLTSVIARLSDEVKYYQSEIAARSNAQSEAQGRIVETYIKLLSDTKSRKDSITQEIANLQQHLLSLENTKQTQLSRLAYEFTPPSIEVPARMPNESATPPDLVKNIIYSCVLGAFLAILWILVRTYHIRIRSNNPLS